MIRKLLAVSAGLTVAMVGSTAMAEDANGFGLSLGVRLGYALPLGSATGDTTVGNTTVPGRSMSDSGIKGAIPLQLDALYRITPGLRVGLYFSYAYGLLDKDKLFAGADSVSGSWTKYGAQIQYHFAPFEPTDFWVGYGIGLENLNYTATVGPFSGSGSLNGLEFAHLMAGADFQVAPKFGLGPFVDFSLGQYSSGTTSNASASATADIPNKAMHEWLFIGIHGNYDL